MCSTLLDASDRFQEGCSFKSRSAEIEEACTERSNFSSGSISGLGVLARQVGLPIDKKYAFDADDLFRIAEHESAISGSSPPSPSSSPSKPRTRPKKRKLSKTGLFNTYDFHPEVVKSSKKAFVAGLSSTAVQRAYQGLHNRIKKVTKASKDLDGDNLFGWVFAEGSPQLQLSDLSTRTRKNEQKGFSMIAKGS